MPSTHNSDDAHVTVVGAGIIGLASALVLAEAGIRVTVVARELPGDLNTKWASPWAGATLIPIPEMGNQEMAKESFRWYDNVAQQDPSSGVRRIKATEYYTDRESDDSTWYKDFFPSYQTVPKENLPPGCKFGFSFQTCCANPDVILPWLKAKLENLGVGFVRAELKSLSEASGLTHSSIVVNATGLGAKTLAEDDAVTSYRGQTIFVKSDFDEVRMIHGDEYTYIIPRMHSGGVILGGVSQEGAMDTAVDADTRNDIIRRANRLTNGAFTHVDWDKDVIRDIVGFRPGRKGGLRVEREGRVVHAYGFKGAGYVFSFGAAAKVKQLVLSILKANGSPGPKARL